MPVEVMARRGRGHAALRPAEAGGPAGPGNRAASPMLWCSSERDNAAGSIYNLVGFQTHLRFPEQKRVFSMIPALATMRSLSATA